MTTTAHEDQFTSEPKPVRQQYSTADILRRNVADLELALRKQAERAEAAEAELLAVREDNHSMMLEIDGLRKELARLREQKPALYMSFSDCGNFIRYWTRDTKNLEATMAVNDFEVLEFYTAPVPAEPKKHHEFASVMLDAQPFITAETYGGRYIVAMRFERLGKMQDCHAALLALLQSRAVKDSLTSQADCRACVNRGRVNGLSQETYCESCVHEGRNWRKNHFLDAVADRLLEGGE